MIEASVRWLSATEAAHRVSAGQVNPQDVVQAHLDAIDRFDSRIHAYIH
ncbi:MAG: amidase, partial [Chloroflexi bacterium]